MILNLYYSINSINPFWYNSINKPNQIVFDNWLANLQNPITLDSGIIIEDFNSINPIFIMSYESIADGQPLNSFVYASLLFNTNNNSIYYFIKSFKKWNMQQVRIELELDFWTTYGITFYTNALSSVFFIERLSLPRYLYLAKAQGWYVDFKNQFWLWKSGEFDHLKKNQFPLDNKFNFNLNNDYPPATSEDTTVNLVDWNYNTNTINPTAINLTNAWVDNSYGKYLLAIANTNGISAIANSTFNPTGIDANSDYLYICTTSDTQYYPNGSSLNTFQLPSAIKQAVIYLPFSPFYRSNIWQQISPFQFFSLAAITGGDPEIKGQNSVCYSLGTFRNCFAPNNLTMNINNMILSSTSINDVLINQIITLFTTTYQNIFGTTIALFEISPNTLNTWFNNPLFLNEQFLNIEFNYGGSVQIFNFLTMTPFNTTFSILDGALQWTIPINSLISPTEQALYLNNFTWFYKTTNPYFFLPLTSEFPTTSNAWLNYLNSNLSSYNTSQNQIKLNIAQSEAELASNLTFSGLGLADSIRNDADFFSSAGGALSVAESATNAAISDGFSIAQSQLAMKQLTTNAKADMNRQSNINLTGNPNIYMNALRLNDLPYRIKTAPLNDLREASQWYFLWGYSCNNYLPLSVTNAYKSFNFFKTKHSLVILNTLTEPSFGNINFITYAEIVNIIAKMFDEGIRLWNVPFNLNVSNLENENWINPWL